MRNIGLKVVFITLIFFILFPQLMHAAVTIDDKGHFFSTSDAQALNDTFTSSQFNYLITTVEQLHGQSIEQAAQQIFDERRSEGIDAVILLSMEDGEIYLNVGTGTPIERVIKKYGGRDPFIGIIDDTFIPYAIDGDFSKGMNELIRTIEDLYVEGNSGASETNPIGDHNQGTDQQSQPIAGQDLSTGMMLFGLGMILLLILAATFIFITVKRKRIRQQIDRLLEGQTALLSGVYEPYNQANNREGLSKGETHVVFKDLSKQFLQLLTKVQQRETELKRMKIPYGQFSEFSAQLHPFEEQSKQDEMTLAELKDHLATYLQQELETAKQLKQLQQMMRRNDETVQKMQTEAGRPLKKLTERRQMLSKQLAELMELEESFDFIQANRKCEQVHKNIVIFIADTNKLHEIASEETGLSEKITRGEEDIRQFVKKEKLTLVDEDPYAYIADARSQLVPLKQAIDEGRVDTSQQLFEMIVSSLDQSSESVRNLVTYRDNTKQHLNILPVNLQRYRKLDDSFSKEITRLRQSYAETHWRQLPGDFTKLTETVTWMEQQIAVVRQDLLDEVQQYKKAHKTMNQLLDGFREVERLYEACFHCYSQLERRKAALLENVENRINQLTDMKNEVYKERLPIPDQQLNQLQEELALTKQQFNVVPTNLDEIEQRVMLCEETSARLQQQFKQLLLEKQTAVREWNDLKHAYKAAESRFGFQLINSHYRRRYQACDRQISQLINSGSYSAVKNEVSIGMGIIQEMKEEHARRVRQQQMAAMAAAARSASRNKSSGGGSHWGGGGSRGGGSGWGGSSGGGSSFGSRGSSGGRGKWK